MSTRTIWITRNRQKWTDGDPSCLQEELVGFDDTILRFETQNYNDDFAVVTRNGKTYALFDYEYQADAFWEREYAEYSFYETTVSAHFIISEPGSYYDSEADAREDNCFDTVYLCRGETYIVYGNKIVFHSYSEDDAYRWMFNHKGVEYKILS